MHPKRIQLQKRWHSYSHYCIQSRLDFGVNLQTKNIEHCDKLADHLQYSRSSRGAFIRRPSILFDSDRKAECAVGTDKEPISLETYLFHYIGFVRAQFQPINSTQRERQILYEFDGECQHPGYFHRVSQIHGQK